MEPDVIVNGERTVQDLHRRVLQLVTAGRRWQDALAAARAVAATDADVEARTQAGTALIVAERNVQQALVDLAR